MARDSWAVRVRLGLRGAVTGLALAGGLLLPPVVVAGPAPDDAVGVGLAADTPVGIASGSESAIGTGDAAVAKRAILVQWSDRLREAGLSDLESWQREIGALLQAASSEGLERARSATTYSELIDALQGLAAGDKPSGADGLRLSVPSGLEVGAKALGDADRDLVYVPLTPCRIIDTRVSGGAIAANSTRSFDVSGAADFAFQGGSVTNCGLATAGDFAAAALMIIAVTPSGAGYLVAYPFGTSQPLASTLNYTAGAIIGNSAVVKLDQGPAVQEMTIYTFAQTDIVVDIYGYYRAPPNTLQLQCQTTAQATNTVAAGTLGTATAPTCAAGYTPVATNCESSSPQMPFVFASGGVCSARNNGAASADLRASVNCCRTAF